ncbi:MAG: winged helix-turn-helix transcriptional regulator [Mesorhizobium sp.]|uniref:ArsR/SmtB family transcription factor n=1 Tax=Mesorhizobium sp. TaxID=1871066 RepID=UPI001208BDAF|nr:metalloregulator ArsR/SmtB family transcription factor [Mesorhizobium sp.]TIS55559.1 MAG: winged helix-turn-helix transcriptional regulator [Mesorhizobium sp.]TIS87855.1 MAG: winged helix-turn-helix transcriptional regulator [Mesorhizobium sp.]TJW06432.1 MAG: winged helix-turn-helix transcriptional regulator [Mesorhizobium sp.]TJW44839.1 MAG: winged helix-turn-helix transcriptional regulator [Mesorhizobium sp.]
MRNKKIIELDKMAREASELLAAMANEKRLMILCHLLEGETSVNELAQLVEMNQSALSQQLAKLRALKLVDTRRDAQQVYYRLASAEVERILQTLYGIYCDPQTKTAKTRSL